LKKKTKLKRLSKKFLVTEIFILENGREIKLTWDYFNRFPTEIEKRSTRNFMINENKKLSNLNNNGDKNV